MASRGSSSAAVASEQSASIPTSRGTQSSGASSSSAAAAEPPLDDEALHEGWCAIGQPNGYGGPTEALLALAPDREQIRSVRVLESYDTEAYVQRVRDDRQYSAQLAAFNVSEWRTMDFAKAGIDGVSGATQTSYALAEGIRRRMASLAAPSTRRDRRNRRH